MAEGKDFLKMKEINDVLSDYRAQCLEGVVLQGDIEIEMALPSGAQPQLAQSLGRDFAALAAQLFDFSRSMGYPVDSMIQTANTGLGSTGR
jgi:hypothetical protein